MTPGCQRILPPKDLSHTPSRIFGRSVTKGYGKVMRYFLRECKYSMHGAFCKPYVCRADGLGKRLYSYSDDDCSS